MIRKITINSLSSLVLVGVFVFNFLALSPVQVSANHCGGAAPGHPGGNSTPCSAFVPGGGGGSGSGAALQNPLQMNDLVSVIVAIADILLILAVPIIIIFIVYAGFLYVTAQGNPTKIQDANRALLYALIGGAIILGAKVISAIVANTVNSITVP